MPIVHFIIFFKAGNFTSRYKYKYIFTILAYISINKKYNIYCIILKSLYILLNLKNIA
jgi:hypothetical protein